MDVEIRRVSACGPKSGWLITTAAADLGQLRQEPHSALEFMEPFPLRRSEWIGSTDSRLENKETNEYKI